MTQEQGCLVRGEDTKNFVSKCAFVPIVVIKPGIEALTEGVAEITARFSRQHQSDGKPGP